MLTREAILGTGKLALEGGLHPAQLKDSVTSESAPTHSVRPRIGTRLTPNQLLEDAQLLVC